MGVRRRKSPGHRRTARAGGTTKIKGHFRSPRGPNKGKKRVWVPAHRRGLPG